MSKTVNGGGAPPSNTVAPVISGSSDIGSTLTSTTGTWVGTPVITYAYQWKQNGNDIVGETGSTYVIVSADYLKSITCDVTATNSVGSTSASSNSIIATATAPVNTVAPVISGTAVVGQTLSSTTGTWTGTPTITYAYQWKRNGSNIASATSSTYTLVQADATFAITCAVTATNVAGSAEATSNSLTILDADANAFLAAAVITNTTQVNAVNQLTVDLKNASIWTKMKAMYPMVGGTATTHKWNLKDPQDTNAAFRLVFSGGWTHSATGAKPNGTNAYADTFLNPGTSILQNSSHISYYSRTQSIGTEVEIGSATGLNAGDAGTLIEVRTSGTTYYRINSGTNYISFNDSDSRAFYIANRTASNVVNGWRNSTKAITGATASTGLSTRTFWLGALNSQAIGQFYSIKECAFASIGDGLTDVEAVNFYTAVQAFQTALGRSFGTQTVSDPDAQAFVTAASIIDQVQANAVNQLVIDMKAASIWTKMKAVYPFIGGTATSHKWNLKNPLDTNAAFRLTFTGGWTHSSTGALPNGTNGYADTFLNASTILQQFSHHHAFYHNTDNSGTGLRSMGGAQGTTSQTFRTTIESSGTVLTFRDLQVTNAESGLTAATLKGFRASSRTANNNMFIVKADGTSTTSTTTTATAILPNLNCYLAAHNSGTVSNYAIMSIAFHSIGDGLTTAEGLSLRNAVQTFQTTLGRNV